MKTPIACYSHREGTTVVWYNTGEYDIYTPSGHKVKSVADRTKIALEILETGKVSKK